MNVEKLLTTLFMADSVADVLDRISRMPCSCSRVNNCNPKTCHCKAFAGCSPACYCLGECDEDPDPYLSDLAISVRSHLNHSFATDLNVLDRLPKPRFGPFATAKDFIFPEIELSLLFDAIVYRIGSEARLQSDDPVFFGYVPPRPYNLSDPPLITFDTVLSIRDEYHLPTEFLMDYFDHISLFLLYEPCQYFLRPFLRIRLRRGHPFDPNAVSVEFSYDVRMHYTPFQRRLYHRLCEPVWNLC
jgi:hypothetical protein